MTTTENLTPSSDVLEHVRTYARAFNSGDAAAVNALYTEDAVSTWDPDSPTFGAARAQEMVEFLALGPKLTTEVVESHVISDTALMVVNWTMEIPDEDGSTVRFTGTGTDVLRRVEDGTWRFAIDNPNRQEA